MAASRNPIINVANTDELVSHWPANAWECRNTFACGMIQRLVENESIPLRCENCDTPEPRPLVIFDNVERPGDGAESTPGWPPQSSEEM